LNLHYVLYEFMTSRCNQPPESNIGGK